MHIFPSLEKTISGHRMSSILVKSRNPIFFIEEEAKSLSLLQRVWTQYTNSTFHSHKNNVIYCIPYLLVIPFVIQSR